MALFALVHGAWHGAWCWDKVLPELEQRGHRAIAMDMPVDSPTADWNTYADAVGRAIGDTDDDLVLVGHSMAGVVIPVVAEQRPVKHCVFLASILPVQQSLAELFGDAAMYGPGLAAMKSEADGGTSFDLDGAIAAFYNDCPREVGEDAHRRLRVQYSNHIGQAFPITKFPSTPSTYIVCARDQAISTDWGRKHATDLGMDVVEMDASHSPFLSKPAELAEILVSCA